MNPPHAPPPHDFDSVRQTYGYLSACNKLFENGFLSHSRITQNDRSVLHHIDNGYSFFVQWYNNLEPHGLRPSSSLERRFIAWQTWDLLRVCVYGFRAFCDDFLQRHPQYYIVPLKWNGSAVETLFAQFKRAAGGKLDSTNYATAREAYLLRRDAHGHRATQAARGYRDVPLYIREAPLGRRWTTHYFFLCLLAIAYRSSLSVNPPLLTFPAISASLL